MSIDSRWLQDYNFIQMEEVDSTNKEALNLAKAGVDNNHVILAKKQTNGRGSQGRTWVSNVGNLCLSILLTDVDKAYDRFLFPFMAANAVYEAIDYFANESGLNTDIKLKWPNDVLLNNKKIAGILVESIEIKGKRYVVIGIGINIENAPTIETRIIYPSFLANEGILIKNKDHFLNFIVNNLHKKYIICQKEKNFGFIRKDWLSRAYRLGEEITMINNGKRIFGKFEDISDIGEIGIRSLDGTLSYHNHGDITT